jgi:hypothetical protein
VVPDDDTLRRCESCDKRVMSLQGVSDAQAEAIFAEFPHRCVYIAPNARNVQIVGHLVGQRDDPCPFRRIGTARGQAAINQGAKAGY